MIFDTHSHCYWHNLEPHLVEILEKMQEKNVRASVQIGCDLESSRSAIWLAKKYPKFFWASVGLHPENAQNRDEWREDIWKILAKKSHLSENFLQILQKNIDFSSSHFEDFLEFLHAQNSDFWEEFFQENELFRHFCNLIQENHDKIVAIGECGLDFHYIDGTDDGQKMADFSALSRRAEWQIENQKFWWLAQWKMAQKHNFPLIIHTRDARAATVDFMKKYHISRVVMHCYSENPEMARELLDFSNEIYFSFSGIVTYKKSEFVKETVKILPLQRILVETDSPFLAPQVVRGSVNNPSNVAYNLEAVCALRSESREEIERQIFENSLRFYGISPENFKN